MCPNDRQQICDAGYALTVDSSSCCPSCKPMLARIFSSPCNRGCNLLECQPLITSCPPGDLLVVENCCPVCKSPVPSCADTKCDVRACAPGYRLTSPSREFPDCCPTCVEETPDCSSVSCPFLLCSPNTTYALRRAGQCCNSCANLLSVKQGLQEKAPLVSSSPDLANRNLDCSRAECSLNERSCNPGFTFVIPFGSCCGSCVQPTLVPRDCRAVVCSRISCKKGEALSTSPSQCCPVCKPIEPQPQCPPIVCPPLNFSTGCPPNELYQRDPDSCCYKCMPRSPCGPCPVQACASDKFELRRVSFSSSSCQCPVCTPTAVNCTDVVCDAPPGCNAGFGLVKPIGQCCFSSECEANNCTTIVCGLPPSCPSFHRLVVAPGKCCPTCFFDQSLCVGTSCPSINCPPTQSLFLVPGDCCPRCQVSSVSAILARSSFVDSNGQTNVGLVVGVTVVVVVGLSMIAIVLVVLLRRKQLATHDNSYHRM